MKDVTMSVEYIGLDETNVTDRCLLTGAMFRWRCTLQGPCGRETFDYLMGVGHAKDPPIAVQSKCSDPGGIQKDWRYNRSMYSQRLRETWYRWNTPKVCPCPEPTLTDLLSCITIDAEAGDLSFEEFCDEFGYDTDSRSAMKTWESCAEYGRKCRRVFGGYAKEVIDQYKES